ncbi:MAG: hypothetical protein ACFB03_09950 [Paracoccaceae bacterium]
MTKNFRSEAQSVRAAAQAKLSELRMQRRDKRLAAQSNPSVDQASEVATPVEASAKPESVSKKTTTSTAKRQTKKAEGDVPAKRPKRRTSARKATGGEKTTENARSDKQSIQVSAAAQSISSEVSHETKKQTERSKSARPSYKKASAVPKAVQQERASDSDLGTLPGVGEGLVRLFQNCNVNSLQDLANADPTKLRKKMGLPGELLNIESWIEVAKTSDHAP